MKLPIKCNVTYTKNFLTPTEAIDLYTELIDNYKLDESRIIIKAGGKLIKTDSFKILFTTKELINANSHPEEIHGKRFRWEGKMAILRDKIEGLLNKKFELAMCLYYPNGSFFAPYHSDQETSGFNTILPSISLGEVREFSFRDKESEDMYNLDLENGSLLVMGAYCQSRYTHSLLKNYKYLNGRINITFREATFQ